MKIRDFINLFGGNEEEQIELWNCDEREEITVGIHELRSDSRWNELTECEIASWDYDVDGILCLHYFMD